jgi:hypothetical protein
MMIFARECGPSRQQFPQLVDKYDFLIRGPACDGCALAAMNRKTPQGCD